LLHICIKKIIMTDRKQYLKEYRIAHIDKYKQYQKKYRDAHKSKMKDYKKEYRLLKKEIIKKKQARKIDCLCGKSCSYANFGKHIKTAKHLKIVDIIENKIDDTMDYETRILMKERVLFYNDYILFYGMCHGLGNLL